MAKCKALTGSAGKGLKALTQKRHFGTHVHCTTSQYPCEIPISRSSSSVQGHVSKKSHEHNLIHTFATATGNLVKNCDAVKYEVIKASLFNTFCNAFNT